MDFALIHKERKINSNSTQSSREPSPTRISNEKGNPIENRMLVGTVKNRVCILIDDITDTATTITRGVSFSRFYILLYFES